VNTLKNIYIWKSEIQTKKNALVEYLDYQIPVTHMLAVDRFRRYGR